MMRREEWIVVGLWTAIVLAAVVAAFLLATGIGVR